MSIRRANPSDAPRVAEVYLASRRAFLADAPLAHSEAEVRLWVKDVLVASDAVTVAIDDCSGGALVGFLATSRDRECGWIEQLYIHPSAVGRGFGHQLIVWAKGELGPPVRLYTFQFYSRSRRFYEREGFEAVAFGDGSQNEERCPDVLYQWQGETIASGGRDDD